ncbi:hypothetical protein AHF37_10380 [Paragonimus kellicotti]|nr:hypothetical protein AHF37_10380 [Paragonimus kellicotti]
MLDIHPFSAEEKADSLESETDELEQQNPDSTVQKPIYQLNPALVQAALDRFDHHSHANRKRAMPTAMDTYEDDQLASDKLTDSVPTVVDGQGEDILEALRRPVAPAVKMITDLELKCVEELDVRRLPTFFCPDVHSAFSLLRGSSFLTGTYVALEPEMEYWNIDLKHLIMTVVDVYSKHITRNMDKLT